MVLMKLLSISPDNHEMGPTNLRGTLCKVQFYSAKAERKVSVGLDLNFALLGDPALNTSHC